MKHQLTPEEGLQKLIAIFPDFLDYWNESIFRQDNGSFNLHTVFCEFTNYTRDKFYLMSEEARCVLFEFIECCTTDEDEPYSNTDEAVCTCFLENLSGEPPSSMEMRRYMGKNSLIYFDFWDRGKSLSPES